VLQSYTSAAYAKDPAKAAKINAAVPAHLARLSREKGFTLVYISTDYVFNGRKWVAGPPRSVELTAVPRTRSTRSRTRCRRTDDKSAMARSRC
jgi:hypothetical protein